MTRDNTRARAARRQNTEGRPENEIANIVLGRTPFPISYPSPEIRGGVREKVHGDRSGKQSCPFAGKQNKLKDI